jgi:hypothetical protein
MRKYEMKFTHTPSVPAMINSGASSCSFSSRGTWLKEWWWWWWWCSSVMKMV